MDLLTNKTKLSRAHRRMPVLYVISEATRLPFLHETDDVLALYVDLLMNNTASCRADRRMPALYVISV